MPGDKRKTFLRWGDVLAVLQVLTCTLNGQSVTCCMSCRRLDQLLKRYERSELHAVDWLDPLALKKIELLRHQVPLASALTAGKPVKQTD